MSIYDRNSAVSYAKKYAFNPNPNYPYYEGRDCTNFISQCLRAGGAEDDFNTEYPWWCVEKETSICWSVAHSFYWYIITRSKGNLFGIKGITKSIYNDTDYAAKHFNYLKIGDIIQYSWTGEKINHSAIITNFANMEGKFIPLITQHQPSAIDRPFYRGAHRTIFHHITSVN